MTDTVSLGKADPVAESDGIQAGVKAVILDVLRMEMDPSEISADTNIFELGADSMVTVELVFALEERFDIQFDEDELRASMLESVGKITALVTGKVTLP